ncbi:glutathione-disulfide reductase [Xanthomonas graminis]|uniref:Reductase n=1 Tax=Xanthomonas graminis pv. graminis TaxID=134874 RepID=A0A1M4J6J1_9XANT|nr:glutathione-disulfide reductase [Xanthomonas translucens]EKU25848.1 glutathione-disulfide reductase [Xanthomonas translucens pv. graminis ART-Xtg29]OAX59802.1 glutathione-disulfide reductase [Xanthomonas translucens pv. graminis]UKE53341.1 glutathione-disulfide reductase [Xanthomonas translucens pv. graminis]WIH07660.1 glutathione-disulfide reductase [Xanthomonas translucens pv. graminis]WIH11084.1 glutathione-disulfide reductase [Xanthomonas translucens pv. graminis]
MSAAVHDYDLLVLGGGSGGLATAFRAAGLGARVAILEPCALGGTCVNIGCVPKKAMWLAADLVGRIDLARDIGFSIPSSTLSWPQLVAHRQGYIGNIHASYRRRLDADGVVLIPQRGRLLDPHTVECGDGVRVSAAHVVIATGAHALRPPIEGAALGLVSDDFFNLCEAPPRVAIVGGGYIAVELAGLLQALGSRVALFVQGERLLERFDAELALQLGENLRHQGVRLHFGYRASALRRGEQGLQLYDAHAQPSETFDQVFFAIGRRPNSRDIGLEALGVRIGDKREIVVDDYQNTDVPGLYAIGDVAGKVGLTPVAIAAGRKLMERLFGDRPQARLDYDNVPSVVFSHPPLGQVGLGEAQARVRYGEAVTVYRSNFRPMLHALAGAPQRSLFKLVCVGEEERVVGFHLLGDGADEILQGFAVALKLGVTKRQLEDTVAIHPTSAEEVVLMR